MCAGDELGIIELVSKKTPDTSVIVGEALAFMRKHNISTRGTHAVARSRPEKF
jgi:hypothetical protein